MDLSALTKAIVEIGVLPAVIAALIYLVWKLISENNKSVTDLTCALSENTTALNMLAEFVRGRTP